MIRQRPLGSQPDVQLPERKRPRLSSEKENPRMSQASQGSKPRQSSAEVRAKRREAIRLALMEMNAKDSPPVNETYSIEGNASKTVMQMDQTGDQDEEIVPSSQPELSKDTTVTLDEPVAGPSNPPSRSNSPAHLEHEEDNELVQEPDYSEFFKPAQTSAAFVPASLLPDVPLVILSQTTWAMPSETALEKAARLIEKYQEEDPLTHDTRKPLGSLDNLERPGSPVLKDGFGSPGRRASQFAVQNTPTPVARPRPRPSFMPYQSSPLNPQSASFGTPSTPLRPAGFGLLTRPRTSRPMFNTPFKAGMKPGEPGRVQAELIKQKQKEQALAEARRLQAEAKERERLRGVFDLNPPSNRKSMRDFGIRPRSWKPAELMELGIPTELPAISLANAQYYRFLSATTEPLGVDTALETLRQKGCTLIAEDWTGNHWSMILWKLASLICSCPSLFEEKWSFDEVVRQLLYRYEREFNQARRPPFRLITEGDTPSTRPMVVVVSTIQPGARTVDEQGTVFEEIPSLEVSDGWYRLRATIDASMARAISKKTLKVGTKLSMSGIRIHGTKDGMEPLMAYSKAHLELGGNSTTLAKWDSKLGFHGTSFIATLRSISNDGGPVPLMDIVITKTFPVGYLEMRDGDERPSPICEAEERDAMEKWKARRANEELKIRHEIERKLDRLEGIAMNLDRSSGGFKPNDNEDYPPDAVDDLWDELEDSSDPSSIIKGVCSRNAGWLAHVIRQKCALMRERVGEDISKELESSCPPRNVRNFRVVRFRDGRQGPRSTASMRTGQITVWDVLALGEGGLSEGKRYLVTNVVPAQPSSWSHHDADGEAFFNTRKDSRWTPLGSWA